MRNSVPPSPSQVSYQRISSPSSQTTTAEQAKRLLADLASIITTDARADGLTEAQANLFRRKLASRVGSAWESARSKPLGFSGSKFFFFFFLKKKKKKTKHTARDAMFPIALDTRPTLRVHSSAVRIDPTIRGGVQEEVMPHPLDVRPRTEATNSSPKGRWHRTSAGLQFAASSLGFSQSGEVQ